MKVAIATEQGRVSEHFGHCEGFTLYDVNGTEIKGKIFVQNPGHQPGILPVFLKEQGADVVVSGGMGERAQTLFAEQGIKVIVGASGTCDEAVQSYAQGKLKSTESVCDKHEHADDCGEH